jgi:hypothetical protein
MTDRREEPAPRRAGDVREEREAERTQRESELGTSWTSVILGLLAALGAGLILSGIVGGIVGTILGTGSATQSAAEGGTAGLIGLLITLLLSFLIGGYAAGRMASRSGVKHGLLVALVYLFVTVVLVLLGSAVGTNLINFSGVTLPNVPSGAQQEAPQNLGAILTGTGILALLLPFLGGAIGGAWGARTGRRRPYVERKKEMS